MATGVAHGVAIGTRNDGSFGAISDVNVYLYTAAQLSNIAPAFNTVRPASPIATTISGTTHGSNGAYRFEGLATGIYYSAVEYNANIYWDTHDVVDPSAVGAGTVYVSPTYMNLKDDYGAIMNGVAVTEDTNAWNNFIADFVAAGGGRMFIPAGILQIASNSILPSNTEVQCAGVGKTTIKRHSTYGFGNYGALLAMTEATQWFAIRGFTLDLNISAGDLTWYCAAVSGGQHITIENFEFKNFGSNQRAMSINGAGASTPSKFIHINKFKIYAPYDEAIAAIVLGASGNGESSFEDVLIENGDIDMSTAGVTTLNQRGHGLNVGSSPTTYNSLNRVVNHLTVRKVTFKNTKGHSISVHGAGSGFLFEDIRSVGLREGVAGESTGDFTTTKYPQPGVDSWPAGTQPTYSRNIHFRQVEAEGGAGYGFMQAGVTEVKSYGLYLTDTVVRNKAQGGYYILGKGDIVLINPAAYDNAWYGINIFGQSVSDKTTALIYAPQVRGNTLDGIRLNENSENVKIFGGYSLNNGGMNYRNLGDATNETFGFRSI